MVLQPITNSSEHLRLNRHQVGLSHSYKGDMIAEKLSNSTANICDTCGLKVMTIVMTTGVIR